MQNLNEKIRNKVTDKAIRANTLINSLTRLTEKRYPPLSIIDLQKLKHYPPEKAAEKLRKFLGIFSVIPSDYIEIFELAGIRIIFIEIEDKISGFFNKLPSEPFYTIYINSLDCPERKLFSIAQITGHIIYSDNSKPCEEEKINNFAASFLIPENSLKERIYDYLPENGAISFEVLNLLKRSFKVSAQALLYRMRDLSLLNKKETDKLEKRILLFYKNNNFQEPPPHSPSLRENKAISIQFNSISRRDIIEDAHKIIDELAKLKVKINCPGKNEL